MTVRIITGDCMHVLRTLPENSIHMVCTSPPYLGLRNYRIEPSIWGGVDDCEHQWDAPLDGDRRRGQRGKTSQFSDRAVSGEQVAGRQATRGMFCTRCGAWLGAHGLEPSLTLYLENEVRIFREVRRVLRRDGTLWLNIGDCYSTHPKGNNNGWDKSGLTKPKEGPRSAEIAQEASIAAPRDFGGLKPKDRVMLPARVVIALVDDGWYLRDEVVWHKPNPMPSSVEDRTTPAHEMFYMLSKSAHYFYDAEAIKEPFSEISIRRLAQDVDKQNGGAKQDAFPDAVADENFRSRRPNEILQGLAAKIERKPAGWQTDVAPHDLLDHARTKTSGNLARKFGDERGRPDSNIAGSIPWTGVMRNKRSVWTIATEPFPDAHFATFPVKLIEPCILACTSECGVCVKCGAPWERVVYEILVPTPKASFAHSADERDADADDNDQGSNRQRDGHKKGWAYDSETVGFYPTCKCDGLTRLPKLPIKPNEQAFKEEDAYAAAMGAWSEAFALATQQRRAMCRGASGIETTRATVLDPFGGSGTTGLVADRLKRDAVLIERNPAFVEMARKRIVGDVPLLADVVVA